MICIVRFKSFLLSFPPSPRDHPSEASNLREELEREEGWCKCPATSLILNMELFTYDRSAVSVVLKPRRPSDTKARDRCAPLSTVPWSTPSVHKRKQYRARSTTLLAQSSVFVLDVNLRVRERPISDVLHIHIERFAITRDGHRCRLL